MNNEENKQLVATGLERRKEERARRDAALEEQARQLRLTISGNHAEKTLSEIQKKVRAEEEARKRRAARVQAKAARVYRDMQVERIVRNYGILCLLILLLTAVTRMNILVMIALTLGLAVFPMVDIYRLYCPAEEVQVGTSMKKLDQHCFYCFKTERCKKITAVPSFTGRTPKWCPMGRDE